MRLFKDIITGDEMFTDAFKLKVVHGIVYEVEGKLVSEKDDIDESKLGSNPSAEEGQEGYEVAENKGCNIVLAHKLVQQPYTKKEYTTAFKAYLKKLLEKIPEDRKEDFKAQAQAVFKVITAKFADWEFFVGESLNPDGMVALMDYREDGVTPYMWFFVDGLVEEKM